MKSTKHERERVISLEAHYRIVDSMVRQRERLRKEVRVFKGVALAFALLFLLLAAAGCGSRASDEYLIRSCGSVQDTAVWMYCCMNAPHERAFEERIFRGEACITLLSRHLSEGE